MFSVAVKGYGIVLLDDRGRLRTFSPSESLSVMLTARVENAIRPIAYGFEEDIRDALLSMNGTLLLSENCGHDHDGGCCDDGDLTLS